MNIIETGFDKNSVTVPTEEHIHTLLKKENIDSDYSYVDIYIASCIKNYGIKETQNIINNFIGEKNFFVCQHIKGNQLNFGGSLVFSTHANKNDKFVSIPHYTLHSNDLKKKRDILFSFIGSTTTHWSRKKLVDTYETCIDTGVGWAIGLEVPKVKRDKLKLKYIDFANRSLFSLCPRGSGVGTIRLFEVMSMGSIPVIISDNYKLPLNDVLDWDKFSVIIPESKIGDIEKFLLGINNKKIKELQNNLREIYSKYFSNSNLHRIIIDKIKKEQ